MPCFACSRRRLRSRNVRGLCESQQNRKTPKPLQAARCSNIPACSRRTQAANCACEHGNLVKRQHCLSNHYLISTSMRRNGIGDQPHTGAQAQSANGNTVARPAGYRLPKFAAPRRDRANECCGLKIEMVTSIPSSGAHRPVRSPRGSMVCRNHRSWGYDAAETERSWLSDPRF